LPEFSAKNVYLFILLIFPGFIAQSIYDLFVPAGERNAGANSFLALAYGTLNLVITWPLISWAILSVSQRDALVSSRIPAYAALLFSLAVFPALLGFVTYRLRDSSWLKDLGAITPSPTSWDNFFGRCERCWVIFHLKNGAKIGGHYTWDSHASSFPQEPDVYVSEVWRLNEYSQFVEMVERTMGMLIRRGRLRLD